MRGSNSMNRTYRDRLLGAAAVVIAFLGSTAAWAQTCPLCYRAAAASRAGALAALRSGVLILMIPPVAIFGLVTLMAIRRRDRFNEEEETAPAQQAVQAEALGPAEPSEPLEPSDIERELESIESLGEEDHAWH